MPRPSTRFAGFPPGALRFLSQLEKNNNREWFEKNKDVYETDVKGPMLDLVAAVGAGMLDYAPDYVPEPKKAIYRIYRDVRFSKDKRPYKTNVAASFWRQNLGKNGSAGFYTHLDNEEFLMAAGVYMPEPEHLRILRGHVDKHHERLRQILEDKKRIRLAGGLQGESQTRLPKGFLPGHPAEDLLKRKMFMYWVTLPPRYAEKAGIEKEVGKRFAAMAPLVEFLNEPLLAKAKTKFLEAAASRSY
jgi:uncharacterized protein (TIGR02453 family)